MTKESIVQTIGVLVFVATVAVAIAAIFYELNATDPAAAELGRYGVTVNAIAPGFIETDMTAELGDDLAVEHDRFHVGQARLEGHVEPERGGQQAGRLRSQIGPSGVGTPNNGRETVEGF
jgi:NAD(P)-dependent dehydrogenase (short-subunit alcohol dehydrogenase family)